MVGLVVVSHSARLADGVVELARQMGGEVAIEAAGGLDDAERSMGTDPALVAQAIEAADSGEGVLVLMDIGSAVMSAEMALELAGEELAGRVRLAAAPLVEGAVAAAVAAASGADLATVAEEAAGGLGPKASQLGEEAAPAGPAPTPAADEGDEWLTARLTVTAAHGLHARPAARLVRTSAGFDARIELTNATTGAGPVSARSLNAVATLGARQGHQLDVRARGADAAAALDELRALAEQAFGDEAEEQPSAPAPDDRWPAGALAGLAAAEGLALEPLRRAVTPAVEVAGEGSGDPRVERAALQSALDDQRAELDDRVEGLADPAAADILGAQRLMLEDEELVGPARAAIDERGAGAASAWSDAVAALRERYEALEDDYQRARAADLDDLGRRILARLAGREPGAPEVSEPGIVVAAELTPLDAAGLDADRVRGIATAGGSPTSHGAILARSLGVPAVVGLGPAVLELADGTPALLDGGAGYVVPEPGEELAAQARARIEARHEAAATASAAAHAPAATGDGIDIEVAANAGSLADVRAATAAGADSVGLLRTEFLFLDRDDAPGEDEQLAVYTELAEALEGRPLTLRTVDAGADKPLPYLRQAREENPFLGLRGIRLGLVNPELLAVQLRAALRVAASHPLRLMFPMVSTVAELAAARRVLETARADLGDSAGDPSVGAMLEVPAAALTAEALVEQAEFLSIGTNDLTQYTLAAERGNAAVAGLADPLHPAVLRLIAAACSGAEGRGRPVAVCGEMAADPAAIAILVGLGVRELSVAVPSVAAVKQAVRALELESAHALAQQSLALSSAGEVRELVARGP